MTGPTIGRRIEQGFLALAVLSSAILAAVALTYAVYPGYLDHGEANVSIIAWNLLHGIPAYHPFDAPERITNLYGPFTYLWHAWPLALFGGGIHAGKLGGVLAALFIPVGIWLAHRQDGRGPVTLAVGLGAAFTLIHLPFPVFVRPDALMTALAALAVWAFRESERGASPLWTGLAIAVTAGIATDIKILGGIYFAPMVLGFMLAHHPRHWALPGLAGATIAFGPFAMPLFPIGDYLTWFGLIAGKENSWFALGKLMWHLELTLLMPVVTWGLAVWLPGGRRPERPRLVALGTYVVCVLATLYPATKIGANHHYFLPFAPAAIWLTLEALKAAPTRWSQHLKGLLLATLVLMLGLAWQPERRFFKRLEWTHARLVVAEIKAVMADYPHRSLQMGVGGVIEGDQLSFELYSWRSLPVYAGHPITQDAGIVMELTKLGVPMPEEAIERLRTCHTALWLIPTGEMPFQLWGYYNQTVYGEPFRETFLDTHALVESRAIFDVWECVGLAAKG